MRKQFFLDARDYVKYALLEDMALGPPKRALSLIWMLTPDKPTTHGGSKPKPNPRRKELNEFFGRAGDGGVSSVRGFYLSRGIQCNSYRDDAGGYLSHRTREEYFDAIPTDYLSGSIVFLDPDNGLAPSKSCTNAHVKYEELARLFGRATEDTAFVVYQHLPRRQPGIFWPEVARRLRACVGVEPYWLDFGVVAFYVLFKGNAVERDIVRALSPKYRLRSLEMDA